MDSRGTTNYSNNSNTASLADNHEAVEMANVHHPTRRTRHVEIKHFVILQWTNDEFINFIETRSDENYSDSLSKPTGRTKFYEHSDIFMGRQRPQYTQNTQNTFTNTDNEDHIPNPYYITPAVQNIFCSTCNLNPLFDLVHTTKSDSFESLDLASVGRCEDESLVASE